MFNGTGVVGAGFNSKSLLFLLRLIKSYEPLCFIKLWALETVLPLRLKQQEVGS